MYDSDLRRKRFNVPLLSLWEYKKTWALRRNGLRPTPLSETFQFICGGNQLSGFCMVGALFLNGLMINHILTCYL